VRLVVDANVLVSAALSRHGPPARLIERWLDGDVELVLCPRLLSEVERTLRGPKLRSRVPKGPAEEFVALLRDRAEVVADPTETPPMRSEDPDDDYVIALAARERARIASGDAHLLKMAGAIPVLSPRAVLELLAS
jgi:putative PIN family toxin of toxin-antitoxin system